MAIFKQIVQVNNGNTGWTRANVLSALETVFSNLGWHSGLAKTGVITSITPPNYSGTTPGWSQQLPAIAGIAQNNKTWNVTSTESNKYSFAQTAGSGSQSGDNIDIVCNQGDVLTFNVSAAGSPFYIVWDNTGGYSAAKRVNGDYSQFPVSSDMEGKIILSTGNIKNVPSAQGVDQGTVTWNTDDVLNGTYYYVCGNNAAMTGKITINPNITYSDGIDLRSLSGAQYNNWYSQWLHRVYYDYTVPASGGRSAATFRVYRNNNGRVSSIDIINAASTSGWSEFEQFTIPGNQIGGTTPTHDIVFGAARTATNPTLHVTNIGAGTEFYHKNLNEGWAVLRLVNDSSKKFGVTYWGFQIAPDRFTQLTMNSGSEWVYSNTRSPNYTYNNTYGPGSTANYANYTSDYYKFDTPGYFGGYFGIDVAEGYSNLSTAAVGGGFRNVVYCRSTSPTSYPLAIRVYKAQSPQDSNFAIIQFTQTVNEIVETYGTFFLHKGPNYGSGIWDLNHSFQGGTTSISGSSQAITLNTAGQLGISDSYYYNDRNTEDSDFKRRSREALYGYQRDTYLEGYRGTNSVYLNNIYTDVSEFYNGNTGNPANTIYYRNHVMDGFTGVDRPGAYMFDSSINYYRVIKGLPLCTSWVPQPYYLPDDFTLIQFAFGPGETHVRTGDTITISPSEKYEVINSSYNLNASVPSVGLSTQGLAFCARVI